MALRRGLYASRNIEKRRSRVWWYFFTWNGQGVQRSTGTGSQGYVFSPAPGVPPAVPRPQHQHPALRGKLKLPEEFVVHPMRHTYGTGVGEGGADAFTIMRLMGYSTVSVSRRYVHPSSEASELAVRRLASLSEVQEVVKVSTKDSQVRREPGSVSHCKKRARVAKRQTQRT